MLHITTDDVYLDRVLPFIKKAPVPIFTSECWQAKAIALTPLVAALTEPDLPCVILTLLAFAFHAGWAARDLRSQVGNN